MAITKGHRFEIPFEIAFPRGLVLVGDITPDVEYLSQEDRNRGREAKQNIDEQTGKRQWLATVTDPDEPKAKRASFDVTLLADVQPVPTTQEVLPGMRSLVLEGVTVAPKVAGQGEFKYQSYAVFATGIAGQSNGAKSAPARESKDQG